MRWLTMLLLTVLLSGCALTNSLTPGREQLLVADRLYYAGADGNAAMVITAKFVSARERGEVINLRTAVGRFGNQVWVLGDILVNVDCNANGAVATWTVSGPRPLLTAYGDKLKSMQQRRVMYELSWHEVDAHPAGYYEGDEP
ncbi:MAG TPA: hypothetical protein PKM88_03630 [bacterium]|nr:hypothetical protein [bacterium]